MSFHAEQRGFSLVEVLITSAVLMVGVTGFVTLQGLYIKTDRDISLRAIAMQIANEKLDDLTHFSKLESEAGFKAYNDIDDNLGGTLASGNVLRQVTDDENSVHTFNRQWQVTNQYFVDSDADGVQDTWMEEGDVGLPADLPSYFSQKLILVEVSWTDNDGETQKVLLDGQAAPVRMASSYQATNESDNAKTAPEVNYIPGEAPDVIAYDLGNGENIETSKPVPDVENRDGNVVVEFETVRFLLDDDTTKLEQEEFLTLNCACQLAGTGTGYTPYQTVLEGDELVVQEGRTLSKTVGESSSDRQPALCNTCCNDHHDTESMVSTGDYYRLEDGVAHSHYKNNLDGTFTRAVGTGDPYDEVCRFRRVDGFFKLYPDWQLLDIIEFDNQYLFNDDRLSAYVGYTEGVVAANINGSAPPSRPGDRDRTLAPGGYQHISRGIYLDRMDSAHIAEVRRLMSEGGDNWKAITPFYDVNLTLLSNWSSSNETVATVTEQPIQSIVDPDNNYYGTYSRGRINALVDGVATITASARAFNSGITGTPAISPDDESSLIADDTVDITVDSRSNAERFWGLVGNINCIINSVNPRTLEPVQSACETNNTRKDDYVDLTALQIVESPSQFSCTVNIPNGSATPFYSCPDVSETWTGDITFSLSAPGFSVNIRTQYPDTTIVNSNVLTIDTGLTATSNGEYNLIIELTR